MSVTDDNTRLRHMLDAARQAVIFAQGESRASLNHDTKLVFAIVRALEIIGEAATHVSSQFREQHPRIPWPEMVGIRNRLIHAYFEVNLDIVWQTVADELPPLIRELEKLIVDED